MFRHDGSSPQQQQRDPFSNMMFGPPRPPMNERPNPFFQQPPRPNQMHQQHGQFQQPYQGQQQVHPFQGIQNQPGAPMQGMPPGKGQKGAQFMKHFQKEDGSLDLMKIGNSVQQVYGIYGQVTPLVKQLSPLLSFFKK
ncbi:hypothetical protein J2S74_003950 [Evansella vedderi]|uniref:YppG-like protein n=1 Tax=Evansella vedderi TaxID=38282 RepID=A0ABT9ZZ60_9BACI|nr:YppG family protein [Evansella vedderi]MDQ0256530.1 hypothetical protein [Evansella vedderi]